MTTGCRIRMRFGDHELEVEGDEDFVTQTYAKLKDELLNAVSARSFAEAAYQRSPNEASTTNTHARPQLSLIEYLDEKQPKTHPDRVVTIAVYLLKYRGVQLFTSADIEDCYGEAFLDKSTNSTFR